MAKSKLKQNHFTQEQINQASNISIVDYIQVNSIGDLTRQSDHFYRLHFEGHDSIVIDTKKNYFVHNAYQGQKNAQGNLLNFIQYIHHNQIGFKEAMKEALTFIEKGYEPTQMDLKNEKDPFLYDYQIDSNTHIIQDYLTRRGIDKGLIQTLIAQHYLTQTKGGVLIANWTQDGRPPQAVEDVIGASEQPTHKSRQQYKSIKKNSKSHYGFNLRYGEVIEDVYVFEATIDLLSYLTLYPEKKQNAHFLSLEGVKHKTLYTFLKENHADHAPSCQIHIATDNDVAGIEFLDHLMVFKDQFQVVNEIPFYDSFSKNQYRQIMKWQSQQPTEKQIPLPIALSFLMLERPYLIKKYEQKDYQTDQAKYFLDGTPQGLEKLRDAFYSKENNQVAEQLIENSGYTEKQQKRLFDLLKKARARELNMVERIYKDWNDYLLNPSNQIAPNQGKAHTQNQRESELSQDKEVQAFIHQIVQKEEGYYLWHDNELEQLGASLDVIEDFHSRLNTIRYLQDGIHLYIEPSSNEGATGYLSLEGHVLDVDGIQAYLLEHQLQGEEAIHFLKGLEKGVKLTWDKATTHYNQVFERVVTEYQLKEKALERTQEQEKNERTYQHKGFLQPEAEGSTLPVLETSTFERSVTSRPTESSQYLKFTIKDTFKSRKTRLERSIDEYNLKKLNRRGNIIQEAAEFYLTELANSTIHYFTSDGNLIQVNFLENNFMHLTGVKFIGEGDNPEKILHDLARGGTLVYNDIRIKNLEDPFDKIKVLPDLETVIQIDSFYFDNLQNIPRYSGRFDSLIKADDSDLMLLFRMTSEDGLVPVSVFKTRKILMKELKDCNKNKIIGIYRERDGIIEQLSINPEYVKDNGRSMLAVLQNKQYEPIQDQNSGMSLIEFTQNNGKLDVFKEPFHSLNEEDKRLFKKETHLSFDMIETFNQKGLIQKDSDGEIVFVWKKHGQILGANDLHQNERQKSSYQDSFIFTVGTPHHLLLFDSPVDALSFLDLNRDIQDTVFIASNQQNPEYFSYKVNQYLQHTRIDSIGDCLINERLDHALLSKIKEGNKIELNHQFIAYQKYQPIEKQWNLDLQTVNKIRNLNPQQQIKGKQVNLTHEQSR